MTTFDDVSFPLIVSCKRAFIFSAWSDIQDRVSLDTQWDRPVLVIAQLVANHGLHHLCGFYFFSSSLGNLDVWRSLFLSAFPFCLGYIIRVSLATVHLANTYHSTMD